MILHLTDSLAKKLGEPCLPAGRVGRDKFGDWSACLFTADRTQYILFSNTATLYSMVTYGRGVTDGKRLIHDLIDTMRDVTKHDGLEAVYDTRIASGFNRFYFTQTLSGAVAGVKRADFIREASSGPRRNISLRCILRSQRCFPPASQGSASA